MKVFYDELAFVQTHGGVSRYFTEMIKRLPSDIEWDIGLATTRNVYLQNPPFNIMKMKHSISDFVNRVPSALLGRVFARLYQAYGNVLPFGSRFDENRNRQMRERMMVDGNFDLFHMTDPHPRWNIWHDVVGCKPIIATVHDLIPEIFSPKDVLIRRMRRQLLNDASHIIAVSECTKRDLIRLYDVEPARVSVVYHGYLPNAEPMRKVSDMPERYIMYVGKRTYGKNYPLFSRAVVSVLQERLDMSLFLTGEKLSPAETEYYRQAGVLDRIVNRFLSDGEMRYALSNASVFVCPSRYEGFGIPIIDAFAEGCPVILSDASCLPEVGRDAALYFDKDSPDELRHQILRIIDDGDLAHELRIKGLARAKEFSWVKCAEETANIYRQVLASWK